MRVKVPKKMLAAIEKLERGELPPLVMEDLRRFMELHMPWPFYDVERGSSEHQETVTAMVEALSVDVGLKFASVLRSAYDDALLSVTPAPKQ